MTIFPPDSSSSSGGEDNWVNMVETVIELPFFETVRLDGERLGLLICKLDPRDAEDMVGHAIEELATRLSHCETASGLRDLPKLRNAVESVGILSDQLGMTALRRSAVHVLSCIDAGDVTASAATLARMIRVGDISLNTVWDIEGLSI